jgi:hypothetical protein
MSARCALAFSSFILLTACGGGYSNPVAGPTPTPIAAPDPPAPAGRWAGTVSAPNPCSVNTPIATYPWTGTITRSGDTFTLEWRDAYFEFTMSRSFPATSAISFVINDEFDTFTLSGRFAPDWQSLTGDVTGRIDCLNAIRNTTGTWTGQRTGP